VEKFSFRRLAATTVVKMFLKHAVELYVLRCCISSRTASECSLRLISSIINDMFSLNSEASASLRFLTSFVKYLTQHLYHLSLSHRHREIDGEKLQP